MRDMCLQKYLSYFEAQCNTLIYVLYQAYHNYVDIVYHLYFISNWNVRSNKITTLQGAQVYNPFSER